jgi:hypothetical protein
MAVDTVVNSFDVDGDQADRMHRSYRRRSYTSDYRVPAMAVPAVTKTTLVVPFDDIQYVHIETDKTLWVYKNLSPEYLIVDAVFLAFDLADVTQISVYAPDGATIYAYLAGE